jgi:DNA-binding helix-hairpin-helix protein with protein kinase domain
MESKWSDMRQELMVALKAVVSDLRALPSREKFMMEERRRTSQLDDFLRRHHIARQKIPDIGPVRSAMLAKYGIETAWDVKNMGYVPRLGAGEVSLKLWVAGIESRFVYKASAPLSEVAKQDIRRDIAKSEDGIRKRFNDIIEGWMRMRRESDVARLQAILDRQVEERKAALAAIGKSAGAANQQLLEQLDGALRKWGQAVADAAVCPPLT